MARKTNKKTKKGASARKETPKVIVERPQENTPEFFNKISTDLQKRGSMVNILLGALILIIVAGLLINYFTKQKTSPETEQQQVDQQAETKANPNQYTVKEGDTLFTIAEKSYGDGSKYVDIMKANNITDENTVIVGQTLTIPAAEGQQASPSATSSPEASMSPSPSSSPDAGTGGAINQTIWGERITGDTYTVQADDWLSKIAGRAYGDIESFQKIAQANNLSNADVIEVGQVLKIPR